MTSNLSLAAHHYRAAITELPSLVDARINLASVALNAPSVVDRSEALAILAPVLDEDLAAEQRLSAEALLAQLSRSGN